MGRYCKYCGMVKPNESFSGKGHKILICKKCETLPKESKEYIRNKEELLLFLQQSHISKKNVKRINKLKDSENEEIKMLANLAFEISIVKPYKKKRIKFLMENHIDLFSRFMEVCENNLLYY